MEWFARVAVGLLGAALGALAVWAWARARLGSTGERLAMAREDLEQATARVSSLENELKAAGERIHLLEKEGAVLEAKTQAAQAGFAEKQKLLEQAETRLKDTFAALSNKALSDNNDQFLKLAREVLGKTQESAKGDLSQRQQAIEALVKPLRENLGKVEANLRDLESRRTEAYAGLQEQLKHLAESQLLLQKETGNLVNALRAPQVRGRWGEMQLRRAVEMAGMVDHCDFLEQQSQTTEAGRQRPDMVVRLPNDRQVIVDAKVPLEAYIAALEAQDVDKQRAELMRHARQVKDHLKLLGQKSYQQQFSPTPDFVVLFIPGEVFFSAALEQDPGLIEFGVQQKVILATPTTLIALLKAVAYGWQQEAIAREAREISELGRQLYESVAVLSGHFAKLGKGLKGAVEAYNKAIGSVESRFLPKARRFEDLHIASKKSVEGLEPITETPRPPQAAELENKEESRADA
ncbi:MAG: DNA recombination protein RmuC [Opitutales bacterium]